jgi:thiosulfate/3-mercaptopyruvate sulfurtransferase
MTRLGAFHRIGPEAVPELLERDDILVFDVRDLRSYDEGRIAGAGHLTVVTLDAVLQSTPKAPPILIYCYHGFASQEYATIFTDFHFKEVYSLEGGYEAWRQLQGAPHHRFGLVEA